MYGTMNEVLQSAAELNLPETRFRQLGPREWRLALKQVFDRFATTHKTSVTWLWEFLRKPHASIQFDDGLPFVKPLFAPDTPVWLMVEDRWGKKRGNYWVFESTYGTAVAVLENFHFVEYYLVDRKLEWMLLENHHGYVIGVGEPALSLVRDLRQRYPERPIG